MIIELYKNNPPPVQIDFDDQKHTYKHLDGKIIANPSSAHRVVAKPFLIPWAAKKAVEHMRENLEPYRQYSEVEIERLLRAAQREYDEYSKDRMAIGSRVHGWIEAHIKFKLGLRATDKRLPAQRGPVRKSVQAFIDWETDEEPEYLFTERVVYSRTGDHIGTADAAAIIKSAPTIQLLDWKTGKGVYLEHAYQLSGYSAALTEEEPGVYDWPQRRLVHLNAETGRYSQYDEARIQKRLTNHDVKRDYEQFLRWVQCWYELQDGPNAYTFR